MTIRTLEEINEEYNGFRITGRIEYIDKEHETICHLTATAWGFEDLKKSGTVYRKVYADLTFAIDQIQARAKYEKKAQNFILIPIHEDMVFSGEVERYAKDRDGWYPIDAPNEVVTVFGKVWDIYDYKWVPIPVGERKTLTKPQIKKLDKLADQARDVAIQFILTKAKEILEK
jgi:hypothetical protein